MVSTMVGPVTSFHKLHQENTTYDNRNDRCNPAWVFIHAGIFWFIEVPPIMILFILFLLLIRQGLPWKHNWFRFSALFFCIGNSRQKSWAILFPELFHWLLAIETSFPLVRGYFLRNTHPKNQIEHLILTGNSDEPSLLPVLHCLPIVVTQVKGWWIPMIRRLVLIDNIVQDTTSGSDRVISVNPRP